MCSPRQEETQTGAVSHRVSRRPRFMDHCRNSTHEDLEEKAHVQDLQIHALLRQLDNLKADNKIKGWMSRSQPMNSPNSGPSYLKYNITQHEQLDPIDVTQNTENSKWHARAKSAESAVAVYFSPGKRTGRLYTQALLLPDQDSDLLSPPDIVKYCALYPEEISDLFTMCVYCL